MKIADMVGGLIGILLGLFVFWESSNMPTDVVMKIGPGFFPNLLAGFLILFSVVLIINAVRGKSKGSLESRKWSDPGLQRGLITLTAAVAFAVVMDPLGFIPTAILFLTFMMLVMGNRKPLHILFIPSFVTFVVWLVFEKLLHLSMPPGILASIL